MSNDAKPLMPSELEHVTAESLQGLFVSRLFARGMLERVRATCAALDASKAREAELMGQLAMSTGALGALVSVIDKPEDFDDSTAALRWDRARAVLAATPEALTTWLAERDAEPKKVIENLHWRIEKLELMLKNATDDRLKEALRQPPAPIVLSLGDSAAFARGVEAAIAKVEEALTYDLKGGRDGYIGRVPDGEFISREYLLDAMRSLIPSTNKEG